MFLIVSKYLIPKGFMGLAIYPFVLLREQKDVAVQEVLNHEKIHLQQQLELLIVPFFLWYFLEYLIRLVQYKDKHLAYRNISFEREAYANEKEFGYLKKRSFWQFLKHI